MYITMNQSYAFTKGKTRITLSRAKGEKNKLCLTG